MEPQVQFSLKEIKQMLMYKALAGGFLSPLSSFLSIVEMEFGEGYDVTAKREGKKAVFTLGRQFVAEHALDKVADKVVELIIDDLFRYLDAECYSEAEKYRGRKAIANSYLSKVKCAGLIELTYPDEDIFAFLRPHSTEFRIESPTGAKLPVSEIDQAKGEEFKRFYAQLYALKVSLEEVLDFFRTHFPEPDEDESDSQSSQGDDGDSSPGNDGDPSPGDDGDQSPGDDGDQSPGDDGDQSPGDDGDQSPGGDGDQSPGDEAANGDSASIGSGSPSSQGQPQAGGGGGGGSSDTPPPADRDERGRAPAQPVQDDSKNKRDGGSDQSGSDDDQDEQDGASGRDGSEGDQDELDHHSDQSHNDGDPDDERGQPGKSGSENDQGGRHSDDDGDGDGDDHGEQEIVDATTAVSDLLQQSHGGQTNFDGAKAPEEGEQSYTESYEEALFDSGEANDILRKLGIKDPSRKARDNFESVIRQIMSNANRPGDHRTGYRTTTRMPAALNARNAFRSELRDKDPTYIVPDYRNREVYIAADVSGSVAGYVPLVLGLMKRFRQVRYDKVICVCWADRPVEVPLEDLLQGKIPASAGGGTNGEALAQWITDSKAQEVVIITDNAAGPLQTKIKAKVHVCLTPRACQKGSFLDKRMVPKGYAYDLELTS